MLVGLGTWVTNKFVAPRLENDPWELPEGMDVSDFSVTPQEQKGLNGTLWGLLVAIGMFLFVWYPTWILTLK